MWDAVARLRRVCQVSHGDAVVLLEAQYLPGEDRYYFLVESGSCKGWLPESFLSAARNPVVGDRF